MSILFTDVGRAGESVTLSVSPALLAFTDTGAVRESVTLGLSTVPIGFTDTGYSGQVCMLWPVTPGGGAVGVDASTDELWPVTYALKAPSGTTYPVVKCHYDAELNVGIKWGATVGQRLTKTWTKDDKWFLIVTTPAGTWTSPPLSASEAEMTAVSTTLSGVSWTNYRLGTRGLSQETYDDHTVAYALNRIAVLSGIPGIVGAPNDLMPEYDLKGGTFVSHVSDMLEPQAYDWYIGPAGEVVCIPVGSYYNIGRTWWIEVLSTALRYRDGALVDYIRLRQTSKLIGTAVFPTNSTSIQKADLPSPLRAGSIHCSAINTNGTIWYALFYDQPGAAGNCCQINIMSNVGPAPTVTVTSSNPAKSVVFQAYPASNTMGTFAQLVVHGRPPSVYSYDPQFEVNYPAKVPVYTPTQIPDSRKVIDVVETPLWGYITQCQGLAYRKWVAAQRDAVTCSRKITRLEPGISLCEQVPEDDEAPAGIVGAIHWDSGEDHPTMSIETWMPLPAPGGAAAVLVAS